MIGILWKCNPKELGIVVRNALVLFLAMTGLLLTATPAQAAITLTKDGLESAQVADCVIDIDSLQNFRFSSTNDNFQLKKTAGTYQEKNNATTHTIYGIYYWNTPSAGETTVPGSFELVWDNALLDSSGSRHDLHAKFSNIRVKWSRSPNVGEVSQQLLAISSTSIRIMSEPGGLVRWDSGSGTYKSVYDAWETTTVNALGVSCDVTFWDGDNTNLRYNLFARDIDQPDRFTGNKLEECSFGGAWAESFTPGSSFSEFHVHRNSWLSVNGSRIFGTRTDDEEEQNRTAFVSLGTMKGSGTPLKFTWKGSMCSTRILQDWSYTLKTRVIDGVGGSISTKMADATFIKSTTESTWNNTATVPRNSYLVTATPAEGYHITGMWLDGTKVSSAEISAGAVSVSRVAANHTVSVKFGKDAPQTGIAKVVKVSAISSLTEGNPCYSLEGAEYGIYSDEDCTDLLDTLTTNARGESEELVLEVGSYFVREDHAPKGYLRSSDVLPITISSSETTTLSLQESPITTQINTLVQKVDSSTGANSPQGAATLEGAQFAVCFYAGEYSADDLPSTPTRTWLIQTDDNGRASLSQSCKVSGDDFYVQDESAVIPLGTISIQETKAPNGYLLPQTPITVYNVRPNEDGTAAVGIQDATIDNPSVCDDVIRGGVCVKKTSSKDDTPLAGAVFAIKNTSDHAITIGDQSFEPGATCMTIQSQDNGVASTDANALPYGSYTIVEDRAPSGYRAAESWSKSFSITENGKVVDLTDQLVRNEPISIEVPLIAEKTFDGSSLGMTMSEGMFAFELRNEDGQVLQTKTNDADGQVVFDAIGFDYADLDKEHVYTIAEVEGDNEFINYDSHVETVQILLSKNEDGSLAATVNIDDDGLIFHNEAISELDLPITGQSGVLLSELGALGALTATAIAFKLHSRKHFNS